MTIGDKIRMLRTRRNWTQADLAAAVEETKSSVAKWEAGSVLPRLDQVIHLSMLFEIPVSELIGEHAAEYDLEEQTDPKREAEKRRKDRVLYAIKMTLVLIVILLGVLINMVWIRFLLWML